VATSLPGGCLRVAALPTQRISLIAKFLWPSTDPSFLDAGWNKGGTCPDFQPVPH
jgi:hypothetical protein